MKNPKTNINNKYKKKTEHGQIRNKIHLSSTSSNSKYLNNNRYNNKLTKFSNEIIDDAINNSDNKIENENKLNNKNLMLKYEQLTNSNQMISNFIFNSNLLNEENQLDGVEDHSNFGQFLKREKMFQQKIKSNKDKIIRTLNDEFLSKMQDKPNIDKKSIKIMENKRKIEEKLKKNIFENNNYNINYNISENLFNNEEINNNNNKENKIKKKKFKNKLELNNIDLESNKIKRINSENNIKIKKIHSEPKLTTSKINKHIKKSKSLKFIYMNRIKEKYNYDAIIKFNNIVSPAIKIKKIEINKINDEIDKLCFNKIDFYSFCNLLFHFGFVNIKHEEKFIIKYNEIDKNEEIIDDLLIRTYFDQNLITKEFIINEINEIKNAFKSIYEDFHIQKYKPIKIGKEHDNHIILTDINYAISIPNFKLFVFIMTNLFDGLDPDDIKLLNEKKKSRKNEHKFEEENKLVIIKNEFKSDKIIIYELIKKITSIKNIEKLTSDFINDFKNYFSYMIKANEDYNYFSGIQNKEINNRIKIENLKNPAEFTFKPRINDIEAINYIKENLESSIDKKENKLNKSKKIEYYNSQLVKLFPFKPHINTQNLKKVFDNIRYKNLSFQKDKQKNKFDYHNNLKSGFEITKDLYKALKNPKQLIDNRNEKNIINNLFSNNDKDEDKFINKSRDIEKKKLKNKSFSKPNTQRSRKTKVKSVIMLNIKNVKNQQLVIFPEQDYKGVINKFCLENQLNSNQYMKILEAVRNQINQNYN